MAKQKNIFRAGTTVELKDKIYQYHGWVRKRGESAASRMLEHFDLTVDRPKNQFVATRKPDE